METARFLQGDVRFDQTPRRLYNRDAGMTMAAESTEKTDWSEVFMGTLIPAVPTPFKDDGRPDFEALQGFTTWLRHRPIDGVTIWSDTGRGPRLKKKIRMEVLRCWRDAIEGLHLIVEIHPAPSASKKTALSSAVKVATDAAEDASFLLVHAPMAYRRDPDCDSLTIEYFRAIAELGVPLIVSSLPTSGDGSRYSEEVLDTLLGMPEVAAIRTDMQESPALMQDVITQVLIKYPGKAVLVGEDRFCGYSLYRGCHGVVGALGSICPKLQRELIDSWFMRESSKFLNLSRLADHIAEAVFVHPMEGHVQRILIALAHNGVIPESATNDPWGPPISPGEEELVRATLDALGEWSDVKC